MKIGIFCPYNYFIPGGVLEHVQAQASELRRRGHTVTIITPKPRATKTSPPQGVVFIGKSTRVRTVMHTSSDVSAAAELAVITKLFSEHSFDILHLHEPEVPFLGLQLLTKSPCPVVGTFHAALPENVMGKSFVGSVGPYIRSIAKQLDAVTVVSPAAAKMLGAKDTVLHTITNGLDLRLYKPFNMPRRSNNVLFVGRLEKRKGPRHLLQAYKELLKTNPQASLDIAGDGPLRSSLERFVSSNNLTGVKFHGFVSVEKKQQLMATCGVFTSPALYGESFGIVLVEAMAMGAGVIAGDNPGYSFVMAAGGELGLVDPTDVKAFAKKLDQFLAGGKDVNAWLSWAKRTVKQYDWTIVVDKYEELYESLVMPK